MKAKKSHIQREISVGYIAQTVHASVRIRFQKIALGYRGINIDGEYLRQLPFADDIVLTTDNLEGAQQMLAELKVGIEIVGRNINFQEPSL